MTEQPIEGRQQALALLAGTGTRGPALFCVAARALALASGCRWGGVAKLHPSRTEVELLAFWDRDAPSETFAFSLEGTPCGEVYTAPPDDPHVFFPSRIRQRFPDFEILRAIGAESYRGQTFDDRRGRPAGHVLVLSEHGMEDDPELRAFFGLVSGRVAAELARWRTEEDLESFRHMVSGSRDQMAFIDSDLDYRAVNPAYLEAIRRHPGREDWVADDLVDQSVVEVVGTSFYEAHVEDHLKRCLAGHSVSVQDWFDLPGQPRRCLNAEYTPSRDGSGEVIGAILTIRDLTRSKRDQEVITELATHEALIAGQLERSARLITEVVARTIEVERVSVWLLEDENHRLSCIDLYLWSEERHGVGDDLEVRNYPDYFDALADGREIDAHDALRDPRTRIFADAYLRPNSIVSMLDAPIWCGGEVRGVVCLEQVGVPRIWQATEVAFAGEVAGLVTQAIMAHEQRRLEERLFEAQKLESLGVLAGGIAHDFNNLLVGILGGAELGLGQLPEGIPARRHLQTIQRSALRASELCAQMLAYAGKGRFLTQVIDLSKLVSDTSELLQASLDKGCRLELDLFDGLPVVEVDATQVRQVVMNLLTNASDALGGGVGEVAVATRHRRLRRSELSGFRGAELEPGEYVLLRVADTGCGMSPETLGRIFEPFFTTKETGRGLGLAAVLGIMRSHSGGIRISSRLGSGTTIDLCFPASSAPLDIEDSPTGEFPRFVPEGLVLVVDDEEIVRLITSGVLEGAGYCVLLAEDGVAGVEKFAHHASELSAVLLDLTMPRMGGEEALAEMQRIDPSVPVILASGYNAEEAAKRFADFAISGFLAKPFRANQLLGALRRAIDPDGADLRARG